ncbi:MAG: hypothetical protein FJ284_12595 [Planctomycetes bacterium]|nr:hypothetical protein [Planctomycetota bacterium]
MPASVELIVAGTAFAVIAGVPVSVSVFPEITLLLTLNVRPVAEIGAVSEIVLPADPPKIAVLPSAQVDPVQFAAVVFQSPDA